MNLLKSFLLITQLLLFTLPVLAQETELDPVTVTSSIKPTNTSVTGRNMIVIQGKQFENLPVNSIDELLRYIPGLEVQSRGPMGSQSDIVMRGGTFQQVLVLIDGLRINDPNTGHFNSYIPIAPSEIERIEVLKGASSAIYGTEAVGGVINIISKTFSAIASTTKKKHFTAQATGGQYGLLTAQAGGDLQDEDFVVAGGLITNNSIGYQQRGIKSYFHNHTGSVSLHYFINENWSLSARSSADTRDFAAQNYYTTFASDTAVEKVSSYWNHLKATYKKDNQKLTIDAGFRNTKDEYRYNSVTAKNTNKTKQWQALAIYTTDYDDNTSLTTGGQFLYKEITSNDRGNHQLSQAGFFAQANHKVGQNFNISPALRAEYDQVSGWGIVPQVNLSYKIPYAQFRASAGKTLRNADFTERYNNYKRTRVLSGRIGNPDLDEERSFSYEAGADYFGLKGLKLSGTFFAKNYSDLIDYVNTSYYDMPRKDNLVPTGTYSLAKNISKVTTTGAEVDAQYIKEFAGKQKMIAMLGITSISSNSGSKQPSLYISAHASFLTNFSLQYSFKRFSVGINGLYKERMPNIAPNINVELTKTYFVINATAQVLVYKDKLSIYTQADNIFNRQYSDILGAVMPGSWWMGGLKFSL